MPVAELAFLAIFAPVVVPAIVLLSYPLQRWADRLRPHPAAAAPGRALLVSAVLPTIGFALACGAIGLLFQLTHKPSHLMLGGLAAGAIALTAAVGVPANMLYSAYRVWAWFGVRERLPPPRARRSTR